MTDDTGNVVWQAETDIKRQVVSEEVSEQIRAMMENNVGHTGTSNDLDYHGCASAYVAGYRIGGKSGTGEQLDWKALTSTARTATTARPSALPPSFRRTTRKFWCWS